MSRSLMTVAILAIAGCSGHFVRDDRNRFPRAITTFAEQLDAILARAGRDAVTWRQVPERQSREHERELWECIER